MIGRAVAASLAVTAAGVVALAWITEGFRAATAEGARRLAVAASPRPLPDVAFEDQDGRPFRLADLRGRPIVVEFFYTRCPTVCSPLTAAFQRLDARLPKLGPDAPALVSVTFDLADTVGTIRDFGRAFGADGERWRFARPVEATGLTRLLESFGVTVIPDGEGGFVHNAAIHVIDREGRLTGIYDMEETDQVARNLGVGHREGR